MSRDTKAIIIAIIASALIVVVGLVVYSEVRRAIDAPPKETEVQQIERGAASQAAIDKARAEAAEAREKSVAEMKKETEKLREENRVLESRSRTGK